MNDTLPASENKTVQDDNSGVIYYGINGYGITFAYLFVHLAITVILCTGLCLNFITVHALVTRTTQSDVSKIIIASLACSDILLCVVSIYNVFYNLIHYKNIYECAFRAGLITSVNLNSLLHLLALTYDRYFKIVFPLRYAIYIREGRVKIYCGLVWMLSGSLAIMPILGWRKPSIYGINYCSYFGVVAESYLIFLVSLSILSLSCLLFCYSCIVYTAWIQRWKLISSAREETSRYLSYGTTALWWRPTKTVLVLTTFYLICWLPLGITVILHLGGGFPAGYTDNQKGTVLAYSSTLIYFNVVGNPIIYAMKIKTVKRRILAVFSGNTIWKRNSVELLGSLDKRSRQPQSGSRTGIASLDKRSRQPQSGSRTGIASLDKRSRQPQSGNTI